MPRRSPGAKAKGLGAKLRALRKEAGVTIEVAAAAIGKSKQVVSRLETGQRSISPDEVAGLLALYGVTGARREQLLSEARTLDDPGWWELPIPGMTQESATLADYEEGASRITSWAPLLVPGLLQTLDLSRAFMLADGIPREQVEGRLTARLRRQARLNRRDVEYLALIGEPALIGDAPELGDQLSALVAAAQRPNVAIRLVPTAAIPLHCRRGPFIAIESPTDRLVVHVELMAGGVFLDEPDLTAPYVRVATRLTEVALDETESLRRIAHMRDRMER